MADILVQRATQRYIHQLGASADAHYRQLVVQCVLDEVLFQLIAIGTYKLFIDEAFAPPAWLKVDDLDDLKNRLVRVIVLVLAVSFLAEVIEGEPGQEIAFLGLGVAAVIAALTYFTRSIH